MKNIAAVARVKVSADGHGVVSHAGMGMVREVANLTGLSAQVIAALADTYRDPWIYEPGAVFADLAAAVAAGADCIDGVRQRCGDREHAFGAAASTTTMWQLVDARIDAAHLPGIRAARAHARAAAWAGGAAPVPGEWLHIDIDATITIDHSDNKEGAAATWKKTWGQHWLLAFLDRAEIADGETLAGLLRPGNAGSNTAADRITVLGWALESLPGRYRPDPDDPDDPGAHQSLVRCNSAGATHGFAQTCRARGGLFRRLCRGCPRAGCGGSSQHRRRLVSGDRGGRRHRYGAGVAEATDPVDLSGWPAGTRLILRTERPHPGAQLRFTDSDGLRVSAFITDTAPGVVPGQLGGPGTAPPPARPGAGPDPQAKATGLANLPCQRADANTAWLEIILAATDWWPGPN